MLCSRPPPPLNRSCLGKGLSPRASGGLGLCLGPLYTVHIYSIQVFAMRLFIAEKPSLGRAIADVLPKPHKKGDGFIETAQGMW